MTSEFAGREPTNESTNESRDSTFAKVSRDTTVVRGNVPNFHAASYRESAVQAAFPAIRDCFLPPDCLALNGMVT